MRLTVLTANEIGTAAFVDSASHDALDGPAENEPMTLHLFEFMDQGWLPGSLRGTLREILQCACSMPFRSYYDWVSSEVLRIARERQCRTVVELGAGTAPVTQRMAALSDADGLQFIVCDMNPDQEAYRSLASEYPSVHPCIAPIDFTITMPGYRIRS